MRLERLRHLDVDDPRAAHLAGASGVAVAGQWVYVAVDDELHLGVFRLDDPGPGRLVRVFSGELPEAHGARKAAKPDLEGLCIADGRLVAVGSGSAPERFRGMAWPLAGDGGLEGGPVLLDLAPLYEAMGAAFEQLNVEGIACVGDRLLLANRGDARGRGNALVQLDLRACRPALREGGALPADAIEHVTCVDLGDAGGVALQLSDVADDGGGGLLFSAVAEDAPNAYDDGPLVGAAVGRIGADGGVRRRRLLDPPRKLEGIAALPDGSAIAVTDDDDRGAPALLLRLELEAPAG